MNNFSSGDISESSTTLPLQLEQFTAVEQQEESSGHGECYGYKLVGDNVDKNMKPSFQRVGTRMLME